MRKTSALVVLVGFLVGACGGSSSSGIAGSAADGGADATSASSEAGTTYTLEDVCARTAPKICALRKPCCDKTGGYEDAGCLAHATSECAKDVADVRAGRATFHPEVIDVCLPKYEPILAACTATFSVVYEVATTLANCQAFVGSRAEGAACERDSQCARPALPDDTVACDSTAKICKVTHIVGEGAACSFQTGLPTICKEGLYCDASFATAPPAGTCKKSTALSAPCNAAKQPVALECGLGNYCNAASGLCDVAKGAGAACQTDIECASGSCAAGVGASKACTAPTTLVKPQECKGP